MQTKKRLAQVAMDLKAKIDPSNFSALYRVYGVLTQLERYYNGDYNAIIDMALVDRLLIDFPLVPAITKLSMSPENSPFYVMGDGQIICGAKSIEAARECILEFETEETREGLHEKGFYKIIETETGAIHD